MPPSSAKDSAAGRTAMTFVERERRQVRQRQRLRDAAEARADGLDRQAEQPRRDGRDRHRNEEGRPVRTKRRNDEDDADGEQRRPPLPQALAVGSAPRERLQLRERAAPARCRA